MNTVLKYRLYDIVPRCKSYAEVLRELGLKQTGGGQEYYKREIRKLGLSTAHFLGKASNQGKKHKGGNLHKSFETILIVRDSNLHRVPGQRLRKALLESGRLNQCESCGQKPEWQGKDLLLIPDHKNGCFWDNRAENLQLLCPNCHSQTSTFAGRNNAAQRSREIRRIL